MTAGLLRRALVDLDALGANLDLLAAGRRPEALSADLRADAYGLGADRVSAFLRGRGIRNFNPDQGYDLGLALYGLDPTLPTRAVLTVVGEVVAVKRVPAGTGVSYGYSYRTSVPSTLALVGLGYADGIVRCASNLAPVTIDGERSVIRGRIAMDQFVTDLGDRDATVGAEVVLFGAEGAPSIHEWADLTGYPAAALAAGLGPRLERRTA